MTAAALALLETDASVDERQHASHLASVCVTGVTQPEPRHIQFCFDGAGQSLTCRERQPVVATTTTVEQRQIERRCVFA